MSDKRSNEEVIRDAQIDRANGTRDHDPDPGLFMRGLCGVSERTAEQMKTYDAVRDHEKK